MPTQTPEKRKLFTSTLKTQVQRVLVGVNGAAVSRRQHQVGPRGLKNRLLAISFVVLVSLVTGLSFMHPARTLADTSGTINFQARLSSAAGAIAADGNYNVEFKLYNVTTGGTALWTEDYLNTNSQGIVVKNGYLSANLGAITSFPTTINWDQDLYLGMTVRGTASCAFGSCTPADAEMTPRLKLTATPYAFAAGKIAQYNNATTFTSTLSLQAPTGGNQIFLVPNQGAAGTYNLLTQQTAATSYIQLQSGTPGTAQTGNLNISGTGIAGALQSSTLDTPTSGPLSIGTGNASSISIAKSGVTTSINGGLSASGGAISLTGNAASSLTTANAATSAGITIQTGNSTSGTAAGVAIDTGTSTTGTSVISLGTTNAGAVSIGRSGQTTTVNGALTSTQLLSATAGITIGASAGSGTVFTNNGATFNTTLAVADLPAGGTIGSAATTVDIYTSVSVNQTTNAGQTITIPSPTAATAFGRLLYVSNIGTKSFILLGLTINPGATATLIWSNTNTTPSWTFAGADGSSIQNQTTTTQNAGFKINGNGYAASFDAATAGNLNIASSVATSLMIGGSNMLGTVIQSNTLNVQANSDATNTFSVSNFLGAKVISVDTTTTAGGINQAVNSGGELGTTTPSSWAAHGAATLTRDTSVFIAGTASVKAATSGTNQGARDIVGTAMAASTGYNVSFSIRTATSALANANLAVVFSPDGTTSNNATCVPGTNPTINNSTFTRFTCSLTTTATTTTASAYLAIYQTDATSRSIYIDNLSIIQKNSSAISNTGAVNIGGASSQGLILLTLDSYASNPFSGTNAALAGSMYFDTTAGFQCYDGVRWGACGITPNTSVTLTPEYAGAVLHGSGNGVLTADICSASLNINDGTSSQPTICGSGETNSFYKWTSSSASTQTYSIYVSYKLPGNFKNFVASSTSVLGKTDLASNTVQYSVYKNVGGTVTQCGTAVSVSSNVQTSWQTGTASGSADPSSCSFAAGNTVLFKVDVTSINNGNAYAGNINFQYTSQ